MLRIENATYYYDTFTVVGCRGSYALVESSHRGSSTATYWFLAAGDKGWKVIGTVGSALLGAIFLGIIGRALPVINISPFWQLAISGAAIIIAVALNARSEGKTGRIILKAEEGRG